MKILISITVSFFFAGFLLAQTNNKSDWKNSPKTIAVKCDTLVLRENCDYCLGEKSHYDPAKFGPTTTCLCYSYTTDFIKGINAYIRDHGNEIINITIENPSHIIFKLNFRKLKTIQSLSIFGADADATKTLPLGLLSLPTLEKIYFERVGFPKSEIERIKKQFPKLVLVGDIPEYDPEWDYNK